MNGQPSQLHPLAICLKPLPLEDPELMELTEGKVAAIVHKLWSRYDWFTKVRERKFRGEVVEEMARFVTPDHPVLQEWSWLSLATNEEYSRYHRNSRKRRTWEQKFREAKTTAGRHYALTNLWKLVPESHPIVQLYLNRPRNPASRKGWWELEPAPKKAKTAKRSTGTAKRRSTTRGGTISTQRLADANQDVSWL